jgi:hypothetical protein
MVSQNVLLVKLLELICRERELERYIDEILGMKREDVNIVDLVKKDYPELYAAFKAGSEAVVSGTPLAEWPLMNGSTLRELQHLGFRTVEQLADANDEVREGKQDFVKTKTKLSMTAEMVYEILKNISLSTVKIGRHEWIPVPLLRLQS